jgi:tRNA U34 5-carboxymethylaminomethyl modifying GTPase MnmE/TrmE
MCCTALDDKPDIDKDEVVASIMGAKDTSSMSTAAQQYKDKIREQIEKVRSTC